jgi:hypothetical protein
MEEPGSDGMTVRRVNRLDTVICRRKGGKDLKLCSRFSLSAKA